MEYVIAEVKFLGIDDVNFEGFTARRVKSLEEWKSQVERQVEEKFLFGYMEISHSNNCSTTFNSVNEVLNTISFKVISEEEFNVLKKLLDGNSDKVQYGNDVSFLEYKALKPKMTLEMGDPSPTIKPKMRM